MISLLLLRRALATVLIYSGLAVFATPGAHAAVQLPTGFQDQVLASGLDWPTGIAFLPDPYGRDEPAMERYGPQLSAALRGGN